MVKVPVSNCKMLPRPTKTQLCTKAKIAWMTQPRVGIIIRVQGT